MKVVIKYADEKEVFDINSIVFLRRGAMYYDPEKDAILIILTDARAKYHEYAHVIKYKSFSRLFRLDIKLVPTLSSGIVLSKSLDYPIILEKSRVGLSYRVLTTIELIYTFLQTTMDILDDIATYSYIIYLSKSGKLPRYFIRKIIVNDIEFLREGIIDGEKAERKIKELYKNGKINDKEMKLINTFGKVETYCGFFSTKVLIDYFNDDNLAMKFNKLYSQISFDGIPVKLIKKELKRAINLAMETDFIKYYSGISQLVSSIFTITMGLLDLPVYIEPSQEINNKILTIVYNLKSNSED